MDSFGFDFAGGDLLDLGSLGSWTNSTSMGNSPNNGSNGGALPFSVGTPTGVQSLGDDPFASMPSGVDNDFSFGDSPKPSPSAQNQKTVENASSHSTAAATVPSSSAPTPNAGGNMAANYFGAELEASVTPTLVTSGTASSTVTTVVSSTGNDKAKLNVTNETDAQTKKETSSALTSTSKSASSTTSNAVVSSSTSAAAMKEGISYSTAATPLETLKPSSFSATSTALRPIPGSSTIASTSMSNSAASNSVTTSAPSTTSSARPHIGNQYQQPQQQHQVQIQQQQRQQQQYANQMMMTQQNGQPQQFVGQPYQQQMHAGQIPGGVSGAPPTSATGQYMGGQPGQAYRPPASSYEEEFARVKAMMMQHVDLIPPPMEVLRISMSQSAAGQQGMAMGGNAYIQQRGNPAMTRGGAPGSAAYGQYGNPNVMMGGPQQTAPHAGMMNVARMRAAQIAQQQAQQRAAAGRTPGGSNDAQAAWQSENDLPLRRKMIGKIVSLLQQRKPDAPAEWIRRLPDMARRLEDSLYRTAKNRDEYGDFSSLKTRLQHLAVTMGARAQHKTGGNPRGVGASGVPGSTGGAAGNNAMMTANAPPGMSMNPGAGGMGPQGHVVGNAPYGNRMTQQQLMQQQHLQMQMQQNPQMRQQLTPQQLQQFQEAQLQRRQLQMQQAQQQAQMQRQNTLQQQQYQQNLALQRQNTMRQMQQQQMQLQMQQRQNPNYMQQQQQQHHQQQQQQQQQQQHQHQQHQQQARAQAQRSGAANGGANQQRMSGDMSLGESSDFLNLDLSSSLLGSDDLQSDESSSLAGGDTMKIGNNDSAHVAGQKRTISQSQQQMAAAANAAAFKRTKVGGGGGQAGGQPGAVLNQQQHSGAANSVPQVSQTSQTPMQKPVTSSSGSSKTPPMSTVNAK